MKKRTFIKTSGTLIMGSAILPVVSCKDKSTNDQSTRSASSANPSGSFTLPDLPYGFDALEPNIDQRTMRIHHDKHHSGYVRKLNDALGDTQYATMTLEEIMNTVKEGDTSVRNNGGGHYNHSLFWSIMSPKGKGLPKGDLLDAINSSFDSFDEMKNQLSTAAKTRFGSGWAWLCQGEDDKLFVTSTPNQDNPLMTNITDRPGKPLLGIDVWEHAYYLLYQNRRGDYINNFFNVINWNEVSKRLG